MSFKFYTRRQPDTGNDPWKYHLSLPAGFVKRNVKVKAGQIRHPVSVMNSGFPDCVAMSF